MKHNELCLIEVYFIDSTNINKNFYLWESVVCIWVHFKCYMSLRMFSDNKPSKNVLFGGIDFIDVDLKGETWLKKMRCWKVIAELNSLKEITVHYIQKRVKMSFENQFECVST